MNKTFLMALMLASGMALAQSSGSSPGSTDQQQPSTQQPSTDQQQPSSQQNQPTTSNQTPASTGQSSLTGCLKGSDGSWVLVAEGQSTPITGDSATLTPHNGHQVQVKGTPGSDGSFQVTDVVMIAESCPNQESDASSAGAAAGAVAGAAGASAAVVQNTGESAVSDAKMVAMDTSQAAQNPAQSTDKAGSQSATQPTAPQSTAPQSATPQSTTPAAPAAGDQTSAQDKTKIPQTASPLPLLGLLGLGSLVSGLVAGRKK